MLQQLSYWMGEYALAIKDNPVLAMFAVYATGVLTYVLRNVPLKTIQFIKNQSTTTLELDNSGTDGNVLQYTSFINWYGSSRWFKHSRYIFLGGVTAYGVDAKFSTVRGPGVGFHFFFIGWRLYWFSISNIESNGSDKQKKRIDIHTFGRNHQPLYDLISKFEVKTDGDRISVYFWDSNYVQWRQSNADIDRNMNTVVLKAEIKENIIKQLDAFANNRTWYRERNLAYKLSFLFRGPSGTGKTSIAKAIACYTRRQLYLLDPSTMDNDQLRKALGSIPPNSCALIEDIDASTKAVHTRTDVNSVPEESVVTESSVGKLTLSGLLNALDGVVELNNIILIVTTNHFERLDPALVRRSRIDYNYLIDYFTHLEAREYFNLMYPSHLNLSQSINADNFEVMPGCDIQAIFKDNPDDPESFVADITKKKPIGLEVKRFHH